MACGCPGPRPPAHRFRDPHAPRASPPTGPEPGESCGVLLPVSLTQTLTNRAGDGLLSGTGGSPAAWGDPGRSRAPPARCPRPRPPRAALPGAELAAPPAARGGAVRPAAVPGTCPHRCASSSAPSVPVPAAQRAPQPGTAQRQVRPGAPAEGSAAVCARRPRERPGVDEGGAARGPLPPAAAALRPFPFLPGASPSGRGLGHSCSPVRGGEI